MLYYKIINDKTVISDCRTLYIEEQNQWLSNPSQEQIFHEGWAIYTPPPTPPQTEPYDSEVIAAVKKMLSSSVESLTDEEALEVAALYPTWASMIDKPVVTGERYWYNEKLYKVVQNHTVQADWTPDVATSLFTEVSVDPWPEWVQPTGAQDAYMTGDQVSYEGHHWICTSDYNIYAPGVFGWEQAD
jgi:hypothetical protein